MRSAGHNRDLRRVSASTTLLAAAALLAALLGMGRPAQAQPQAPGFPSQRINLVVAFAPGGAADAIARLIGPSLASRLGHPVVVENRGGAAGAIGARSVAGAPADGTSVLVTTTSLLITEALSAKAGYTIAQFTPVAIPASTPEMFATAANNPARDLGAFVARARAKSLTYATSGAGSGSHLGAAYFFKSLAQVEAVHVPYQGGGPAVGAAIGGHVDLVSNSLPAMIGQVQQGALRALAVASPHRIAALPDVPTFKELGYDYDEGTWVGLFVPAKTDPAVVMRLNREINAIMTEREVHERLQALGFEADIRTVDATARHLAEERDKFRRMIEATGIATQ
jgi:tripartite-type tricarboxylate transporter receptor subunit TctC